MDMEREERDEGEVALEEQTVGGGCLEREEVREAEKEGGQEEAEERAEPEESQVWGCWQEWRYNPRIRGRWNFAPRRVWAHKPLHTPSTVYHHANF